MITTSEVIGECPLGQLIKETKIDRFGFFAGQRIYKLVRKDWYFFNLMGDGDRGITYSDIRYYHPTFGYKEIEA